MAFQDKSDSEILDILTPIMDKRMDASTVIDHGRHTRRETLRTDSSRLLRSLEPAIHKEAR